MRRLFLVLAILCLGITSLSAAVQLGEWKKRVESEGIISWTRTNSLSTIDEVRTEGIINAPVPVVEAILRDTQTMTTYMFRCSEARNVNPAGTKSGKDGYYMYFSQSLPFPLNDRYSVARIEWMLDRATPAAVIGKAHGIETDIKPKNVVRMPTGEVTWMLFPAENNTTRLTYQALADPGGNIPKSVVNMMMKYVGVSTLKNMRKLAQQEPYRSAKDIVTTTPYHE